MGKMARGGEDTVYAQKSNKRSGKDTVNLMIQLN